MKQKIRVRNSESEIKFKPEDSLLEALLRAKVAIGHSCGGMGTCGTCQVRVESGLTLIEPPNEIEMEMITDRQFNPNERLACQIKPQAGTIFKIPDLKDED